MAEKEYVTKTEATEILEQSWYYLKKCIDSGEISTVQDPKSGKKMVLVSDVYKIKKKIADTNPLTPELLKSLELKAFKLDILDAVAFYDVPVSALSFYDDEIKAVASLSAEERKVAFNKLVHKIVTSYKREKDGGRKDE